MNQWFTDVAATATRTSVGVAVLDSYLYAVKTLIQARNCLNSYKIYLIQRLEAKTESHA